MLIGIDASRAFLKRRTGIEEYSYQVIKHLRDVVPKEHRVILYVRKKFVVQSELRQSGRFFANAQAASDGSHSVISSFLRRDAGDRTHSETNVAQDRLSGLIRKLVSISLSCPDIDFELPKNWEVRGLWAPRFWTQVALSFEMLFRPPDVLFVPAHTIPIVHPKRTIVTIHGLEYEFCPDSYSPYARWYMRLFIGYSCRAAKTVIAVSENTKRDLIRLYQVAEEKIVVAYEGYEKNFQSPISSKIPISKPYLLFIGRLEQRKNIVRIIEAFEILKEKYQIPHELVLVGKPGYGYQRIKQKVARSKQKNGIREVGYVSEEEKWALLRGADVFLFPTLYEGFGIPVLEAQSVDVPVVTSSVSSLLEVGGEGAAYVDPKSAERIAEGVQKVLSDRDLRGDIIRKAAHNVSRFSWAQCARSVWPHLVLDVEQSIKDVNQQK